ncbi:MAG: competence/damage-inducible protein A [Cellulosilyticum sp.]|nr:competence/damage-inducible protein A [Cellulosilyticum sp.]
MKIEIIAVGNEVLYGHTVNTNASYLARSMQKLGISPMYMTVIGDDSDVIKEAVQLAMKRTDVIVLTGGLGPTPDDLTKEVVCEILGLSMEIIPEELEKLKQYFEKRERAMTSNNQKQAAFPKEAYILANDCGTAPGCILEQQGKTIILLPGPPKEMKHMFDNYVIPFFKEKVSHYYESIDIKCFGLGESELATRIAPLLGDGEGVNVATYVGKGEVIVRIAAYATEQAVLTDKIDAMKEKIEQCLGPWIIGYNNEELEEKVVSLLLKQHLTVATVESCTGGLIAATLVNCGGVSICFKEGIVTYSNEAKMKYVGVKKETLDSVGAVSEETAKQMAEGIRKATGADIGLSSTGIAGPGGGTPTKPVGLVYIGIAMPQGTEVFKLQLHGTRQENRERTVKEILFRLYKKLQ